MGATKAAEVKVRINDAEVGGTVQLVNVEDHDRLIDTATIVIDDPKHAYAESTLINQAVSVDMGWEDEKTMLFIGFIRTVSVKSAGGSSQTLTIQAFDPSYQINQRPPPEDAQHKGKLSEVVKKIVQDTTRKPEIKPAIVVKDDNVKPEPDPEIEITQPSNVKDWDFITKLAISYGCRAFIEVNNNQPEFFFISEQSLVSGDPMGTFRLCSGFDQLLEFKYQQNASGASPKTSVSLDGAKAGETVTATSDPTQPPLEAKPSDETRSNVSKNGGSGSYDQAMENAKNAPLKPEDAIPNVELSGTPSSDPNAAQQEIKRDPTRLSGLFGEGTAVGTIKLRAKGKVTIKGISPWAEGDWYVTRVNHIYTRVVQGKQDRSTYRSKFAVTR